VTLGSTVAFPDSKSGKGLLEKPEAFAKLALLAKHGRAVQGFDYRGHETKIGGKVVSKTMSVRMDRENYDFLHEITEEEGGEVFFS
jgi:hypothetical protein